MGGRDGQGNKGGAEEFHSFDKWLLALVRVERQKMQEAIAKARADILKVLQTLAAAV